MARRQQARKTGSAAVWRAPPVFAYNEPTEPFDWVAVWTWPLGRIVRSPPQGLSAFAYSKWREEQDFTASTRWFEVPASGGGWVRKDKLQAISALKPNSVIELVRPRYDHTAPYLRVTWTAATGRKAWLSFVLQWPPGHELVRVEGNVGVEARARSRAARQAALDAEGQADDTEAGSDRPAAEEAAV